MNSDLVKNYFSSLNDTDDVKLAKFNDYFLNFYNFCFEQRLDNMIEEAIKFK